MSKYFWILLIALFSLQTRAQIELEDVDISTHDLNCHETYYSLETDSVRQFRTEMEVLTIDRTERCIPADYVIEKNEFYPWRYYRRVNSKHGDSLEYMVGTYMIPHFCMYWEHLDTPFFERRYDKWGYKRSVFKKRKRDQPYEIVRVDSIRRTDEECLHQLYSVNSDSVHTDTIASSCFLNFHGDYAISSGRRLWYCEYFYGKKHGYEEAYYSISEIKAVFHEQNHQFLKYSGEWRKGQKHGDWVFYSVDGRLLRKEKYRRGKLLKSEVR